MASKKKDVDKKKLKNYGENYNDSTLQITHQGNVTNYRLLK
jgi:hypothetical protein